MLVIFGDSIAKGVGTENGGWSTTLEYHFDVVNFAEDGERAEGTLTKLRVAEAGDMVIVATGVNNCGKITGSDGESILPDISSFERDYKGILEVAKLKFQSVIALGLIPTEGTLMPLGAEAVVEYSNEVIADFNDLIAKLCVEAGVEFVDVLPYFLGREKELLSDHIHPNDEGHQIILGEILKKLN